MQSYSDIELLKLLREDNQAALEELFNRYYYRLCDFAFHYVRSFNLTEEVVSDVFFKIWKSRHEIDITSRFKSYIYTATRNQALNYLRKERRDWESLDDTLEGISSTAYRPD